MSVGLQLSPHHLPARASWPRALAALKLAVAMLVPEGSVSAQSRKDYAQTPTPKVVAQRMLEIAGAGPNDLVADLGSGDGRIPILAAQAFGARALGVELDKELHEQAVANLQRAGVGSRVTLRQGDLFETGLADVTLLTLYLPQSLTLRLRRRILSDMQPGSRVVSHAFGMGAWLPDQEETIEGHTLLLWIVPARVDGRWRVEADGNTFAIDLRQTFQEIEGAAGIAGTPVPLRDAQLRGREISFAFQEPSGTLRVFRGRIEGGTMTGLPQAGGPSSWRATRD